MPILGASKVAWAGSAPLYGTQTNPITSDAQGALWATANGANSGVAYVQKAGLNGGNPYQTYLVYTSNKLWVMAGVFAGADSTNSSSGNGFFRWAPCQSPTSTTGNDWGTGTHVFNDTYDFTGYTSADRSARSRAWAELATNKSRFYFYNQAQTSPLIYTFSSSSAGGENASWGTRMRTLSDYFRNGGTSNVASADIVGTAPSGTLQDARWGVLGLGASDAEATTANTNDIVMLVAMNSASQTDWNSSSPGFGGLGVKRSQVSGGYPASFTFNGTGGDSKAGVIATPGVYNGNISFDTDGYITIYQALVSD